MIKINWVGNFQNGYVGEQADQVHIARELESLGHQVHRVPQDIWKAWCEGERNPDWESKLPIKSDFNIITKWHHFVDGSYIVKLREISEAPVAYWVWDYMDDMGLPGWHVDMVKAADLYLGNDVRNPFYSMMKNAYYFPFDVCDGTLPIFTNEEKKYDVVFLGSCIGQGHRIEWLTEINKTIPITCFSWNYEEWKKRGFTAYPAIYGSEFNRIVGQSRVIVGFSVNPTCWGYWSNRVGKVLKAGGNLIYEYAPGMELALGDAVDYFSSPSEAIEKITTNLNPSYAQGKCIKALMVGHQFTSQYRVKQLVILIERFLKTGGKGWDI
jgi:hypothetical protein